MPSGVISNDEHLGGGDYSKTGWGRKNRKDTLFAEAAEARGTEMSEAYCAKRRRDRPHPTWLSPIGPWA